LILRRCPQPARTGHPAPERRWLFDPDTGHPPSGDWRIGYDPELP